MPPPKKINPIHLLDDLIDVLQKVAIPLLPLSFIIAIASQHYVENGSVKGWLRVILQSIFSISTSLAAALMISLIAKPIYDRYIRLRTNIIKEHELQERNQLMSQSLLPVTNKLQVIESMLRNSTTPIDSFFDTFNDIDWKKQLEDATKVDLAAFYWSTDWLSKNMQFFEKELSNGMHLNLYLPHPVSFQSNFIQGGRLTHRATNKIIQTAVSFEHKLSVIAGGKYNIYFVNHGINYMFARIEKSKECIFIFSPFQGSTDSVAAKPPAISINEVKSNDEIRSYIRFELEHLRKGKKFSEIDVAKYLGWGDGRVIVSPDLTCPSNCAFCYVESLKDPSARMPDIKPIGRLIAKFLSTDTRFVPGKHGTAVLIGGMSDPFHSTNSDTTLEVIRGLCDDGTDDGLQNIIHIATRHCIDNTANIRELSKYKNLILNYSICSIDGDYEMGSPSIAKRFAEAKTASEHGINTAIYLRPVLPGVTIKQIDALIEKIVISGIKHVVVGGLYVDDRIKLKLNKYSIPTLFDFQNKKHVLDQRGLLQKVVADDTEKILETIQKAGLTTFRSSMEIVRHFQAEV